LPSRPESTARESTIDALFAVEARRRPEAVAVVAGVSALSYAELDRRADRLAHRLAALGVGPETPVGLCLDRSLERVVATLAILKAGGAYVPLDPTYPAERLAFLLRDTGAPVVVTEERFRSMLPAGAALVCLDRPPTSPCSFKASAGTGVGADGLAYVMYTSGSTGSPKGVAVRHRGVVRLVHTAGSAALGPGEVFLQLAPFSFDASTFEIWGALLNGGRLVVPPPGDLSLADLAALLARHGVTVLWLTAGLFHQMVELDLAGLTPIRQLLVGGDVLSVQHVRRVLAELPGTRLINGYGPTESTTFACCYPVTDPDRLIPSVPLGLPLAGTTVHLLGADGEAVREGEAGELAIGGDGLARGYLDRPQRTAERFVPSPFGGRGKRLYRTGDLGRLRPTGEIEFLGRIDDQVKVRGFRVEPGEVEAALIAHPRVRQAAVVGREDRPGDKRLAAYVVAAGEGPSAAELRSFLAARLPEPMIPAYFLPLSTLPLTRNGKVDRRALAQLPLPAEEDEPAFRARPTPLPPLLEQLAGIWEEVLGGGRVGPADRFLDRGGDSLLATRVLARVRTAFGIELPLSTVLQAPDLTALAERIEREIAGGLPPLPPILPRARDGRGEPLSSAQRRLWSLERLVPGTPAYNIPLVLRLDGPLAPEVLARCLVEIACRHEALRTTFEVGADGEPRQLIAPPAPFPLPWADLSALSPARGARERERLSREEARRPFTHGTGALWRRLLLRLAEREHCLLVTLHHAIADGESVQVLDGELAALYPAFLAGRTSPLPPPAVQPADVAAWERRWLSPERLAPHLDAFRRHLAGAPAAVDLPADHDRPRPPAPTWRGVSRALALPPDLSPRLR
jgi:amino acid adenylation domain-containing protein